MEKQTNDRNKQNKEGRGSGENQSEEEGRWVEEMSEIAFNHFVERSRALGSPVLYLPLLEKSQMKGFYLGRGNWVLDCLFSC